MCIGLRYPQTRRLRDDEEGGPRRTWVQTIERGHPIGETVRAAGVVALSVIIVQALRICSKLESVPAYLFGQASTDRVVVVS